MTKPLKLHLMVLGEDLTPCGRYIMLDDHSPPLGMRSRPKTPAGHTTILKEKVLSSDIGCKVCQRMILEEHPSSKIVI